MLFNSLEFLVFFVGVVTAYFALPFRFRWMLLLAGSYGFYAAWRPEYLLLILGSTLVDWLVALRMGALGDREARRPWLVLSIAANLGLLGFFKYFDFFSESLQAVFDAARLDVELPLLDLLLPVGISFYTFQTLSYSVDVYRGRRPAERHLGIFALYVSFFPQLVAGPIERSTRFLPQLHEPRAFDAVRVRDGLALMLFGFFKKCVVADRAALFVDPVFAEPGRFEGVASLLGTYFFQWQLYCDFSGYSDIAIGAAAVMGYRLMTNFRRPYLATSILDFWNRWHVSLTTWLRDYLYFPLTGRDTRNWRRLLNLLIVFAISGLWHGATWNCVLWGLVNGVFLVVGLLTVKAQARFFRAVGLGDSSRIRRLIDVVVTFHLGTVGLMLFRTQTMPELRAHVAGILAPSGSFWTLDSPLGAYPLTLLVISIVVLLVIQLFQERHDSTLVAELGARPRWVRWAVYHAFLLCVLMFGEFNLTPFFYFQF